MSNAYTIEESVSETRSGIESGESMGVSTDIGGKKAGEKGGGGGDKRRGRGLGDPAGGGTRGFGRVGSFHPTVSAFLPK